MLNYCTEAQPSLHADTLLLLGQSQVCLLREGFLSEVSSDPTTVSDAERLHVEENKVRTHSKGTKEHYCRTATKKDNTKNLLYSDEVSS